MSEVWNNVTIYGPAEEIDRLKRQCIAPADSVYAAGQSGWDGCDCFISIPLPASDDSQPAVSAFAEYVWNFQQFTSTSDVEYSFSFDTDHAFPTETFKKLATCFPKLAFDCACIDSIDEFMGYGWFNPPPGGEDFEQDYDVPHDYWISGSGCKRSPASTVKHEARILSLKEAASGQKRIT